MKLRTGIISRELEVTAEIFEQAELCRHHKGCLTGMATEGDAVSHAVGHEGDVLIGRGGLAVTEDFWDPGLR